MGFGICPSFKGHFRKPRAQPNALCVNATCVNPNHPFGCVSGGAQVRNNNSSRFGKYTELQFDPSGSPVGAC